MRFSNTFDYTISGNRSDLENDAIPPMMIQPFVENAIYHGFANLDYQGALKIAFEKHADFVSFTITDNGSGIEASKNNTDKTKTSLSTTITIERLKSLVTTKNKIDFLEITNNPNEKSGTVIVLRMPYIQTL